MFKKIAAVEGRRREMARVEPRRMTEEMAIRNLLSATPRSCLRRHFGRSPGRLGLADLRACHSSGHLAGAAAAVAAA